MEKREQFSFKRTVKGYALPLKNKWANLLIFYVTSLVLGIGMVAYDSHVYQRDLEKYKAGEISREPQKFDYGVWGRLERYVSDKDNK